jgi:WD repeat-containing protein 1 (actin-interacting protein 1)
MESIPKSMAVNKEYAAVVNGNSEVIIFKNGEKLKSFKTKFGASALAISPDNSVLAIGADDGKVYVYSVSDFTETAVMDSNRGEVTCLSYSPKGDLLAVGDSQRLIMVYDTATCQVIS